MPPLVAAFSLVAAILYTVAVLLLKRATQWNPGIWKVTFICNQVTAGVFLPMILIPGKPLEWSLMWQPFLCGALFVGGQILVVFALTRGDVSVATPLLGLKILMVTGITLLIARNEVQSPWRLVGAAVLATISVSLLGTSGGNGKHRRLLETIITSVGAAACYAVFDVLLQTWGPSWGATKLMPCVMLWAGVLSLLMIPLIRGSIWTLQRDAKRWVVSGVVLMAVQAAFLTVTLASLGHAAEANVVYSSRGLWTVLLIWLVGHWFSKEEQSQGSRVLTQRLAGAGLLTLAIFLVI